jgi:uncharacterized membrane protein YkvA (DUF1232 family)
MRMLIGACVALLVTWVLLLATLLVVAPRGPAIREAVRLLPDLLRLLHRLARDPTLPREIRLRLWALLAYLALPFDVIPDFIPVLGYADDAIAVVWVLRSVVRTAGVEAVRRHWPGDTEGFTALARITGLRSSPDYRRRRPGTDEACE